MAAHRAEQIAAAVVATVTGLTTTGANVFRGRALPLEAAKVSALVVRTISDAPSNEGGSSSFRFLDRELTIAISGHAFGTQADVETTLNLIRKELTIAMQADHTQGLSFVIDTDELDTEYSIQPEGDKIMGIVETQWELLYRSSRQDPSA